MTGRIEIFQAYVGEAQRGRVSPLARPYDAGHNRGVEREYALFREIAADGGRAECHAWGLVSWKFDLKCAVPLQEFAAFAERKFAEGVDCVFINPMIASEALFLNVWEQWVYTDRQTQDLIDLLATFTPVNDEKPMGRRTLAFCNYFLATRPFWESYFQFVDGVLSALGSEALRSTPGGRCFVEKAVYPRDPTMTRFPFLVERLFSTFLESVPADRVAAFPPTAAHYRYKFGHRLGNWLFLLSEVKNQGMAMNDQAVLRQWHETRTRAFAEQHLFSTDDPAPLLLDLPRPPHPVDLA